MSRIRYLADEDFRRRIIMACQQIDSAIEFFRVQDVGLSGAGDDEILEYAATECLITVSHDKRTMVPAAIHRITTGLAMTGLFVIGQHSPVNIVAEYLAIIWACDPAERWHGQIEYLPLT